MNKNLRNVLKAFMLLVCFSFFQNETNAQTFDNGIFFQALARDNYSNPAKDRKIFVQSTIIQSTINGTKVLVEEYQTTTDATGVFGISIGKGTRTGGSLSALNNIDWSAGPYFLNLKISITPVAPLESWNYSKDWVDLGTTSFGTVPYALYAKSVAGFDTKVNVSDTAKMLLPYAKAQALTLVQNAVNTKLNTADSVVAYVTPTQLTKTKVDTTSLSNRINLKATTSNLATVATSGSYNDLINRPTGLVSAVGNVKSSSDPNGATIAAGVLSLTPADGTNGGIVTNAGQYFAGEKTFKENITVHYGTDGTTGIRVGVPNGGALNTMLGTASFLYGTPGDYNTAIGGFTLSMLDGGGNNTAVGVNALRQSANGVYNGNRNTAIGSAALSNGLSASDNVAIGVEANRESTGSYNAAVGNFSQRSATTGTNNTSIGYNSLYRNTTGNNNTAIGNEADVATNNLSNATAIGNGALVSSSNSIQLGNTSVTNVKTSGNITAGAITYPNTDGTTGQVLSTTGSGTLTWTTVSGGGSGVPYSGATGAVNLGAYDLTVNGLTIGTGAGTSTSTSLYNTAVGFNALVTNTTGVNNSAFGRGALRYNTTGNYNTALGLQSLNTNTTGLENTASGALSLFYNTTGNFNTAFGTRALFANTTGTDNAAFGQLSSYLNQAGSYNTTIGTRSMFNNVYGNANTAVGWNSSTFTGSGGTSSSSGGNNNTSLGFRALYTNTLGNDNTAVGYNALQANLTGIQNTTIGSGADVSSNALSNATAIGYGAIATTSNTMQLGNANVTLVKTSGTLITPKIGVGTSTPVSAAAVEINSTTQGFLPPRMRAGQRDSIAAPVQGLVVYCTNCGSSGELEVYNGSTWVNLLGNSAQSVPGNSQYAYTFTANLVSGSYVYSTYKFDGTSWTYVAASPISNTIGNYVGQIGNNHYSLLYNGSSYSMYVFNGTTWSPVSTSGTAPSSVYAGYMGVFNNKLYHYLYNGTGYSTYSFDGTTWQTVNTAGTPPPNGLYGGYLGSFNNISYFSAYNGTSYSLYSFNGTTWTTISNSSTNSYTFLGQIGNTSYLSYYNGSGYSYSTFNGTSFASWNPTGLPSGISGYNFNYMGVINNKLYTAISDNSTGIRTMYSFDGTSFTNLSSITNPGSYYGGFNCYMCSTYFIGGNLK